MTPNQTPDQGQPQQQSPQPQSAQQPVVPPQYSQPATPDTASFQDQPKVQYVVMQKSLEGLGGWLAFFLVIFALSAIGYFSSTFSSDFGLGSVLNLFLAVGYLVSVVMIALRKRSALWAVYTTLTLSFLSAVVNVTILAEKKGEAGEIAGVIVSTLIFHGLLALYFYVSKRVKATLVK